MLLGLVELLVQHRDLRRLFVRHSGQLSHALLQLFVFLLSGLQSSFYIGREIKFLVFAFERALSVL